ncbi:MAG: hypothetical protein HYZ92_00355 [Candidatus Omnitrophica bacterium]|nr:hypothetical protein [Candidatus Omnitrophota bacterium]
MMGSESTPSASLLGRLCESVPDFLNPLEFRVVHTMPELKAALHLVYREYLKRHYTLPHPSELKLSIFHALPKTTTFVALHRRTRVVGTISIVEDSPCGLPMDEVYRTELDDLRGKRLRLAEATLLALDGSLFGRGVFTMFHAKKLLLTLRLFKALFDYLRSCTTVDELVACFNPKHQILYDFLQLRPLGELKYYSSANNNPAIAKRLNIAQTQRRARSHVTYNLFYGKPPAPSTFAKKLILSPADLRELFVETTSIFACASPSQLRHLRRCYPTYAFDEILGPSRLPGPAPSPSSAPSRR